MDVFQNPITDISHLIPQRFPIVMVDALLAFTKDEVTSKFEVQAQNIFYENNVLLEPGLIENMAQTVALHTGYDYFLKGQPAPIGYIGSIKKVEITKLPQLNESITTKATILHEFAGITLVDVEVLNESNEIIASGQMKTVVAK